MFLPRCCSVYAFVFRVMSHNPEDEGGTFFRNVGKQLSKYGESRRPVSSILKQVCNKHLSALCHSQWVKRQPCRHTSRIARCRILSLPFACHTNDKKVSCYYRRFTYTEMEAMENPLGHTHTQTHAHPNTWSDMVSSEYSTAVAFQQRARETV
jgi:hypothetical protein